MKRIRVATFVFIMISGLGVSPSSAGPTTPSQANCIAVKSDWTALTKMLGRAGTKSTRAQMAAALRHAASDWRSALPGEPPAMAKLRRAGADAALRLRADLAPASVKAASLKAVKRDSAAMNAAILNAYLAACNAAYPKAKSTASKHAVRGAGLSQDNCLAIEDAWLNVARALAGLGSTTTISDAAPILKDAAAHWSGEALLVTDAGGAVMAKALRAGSDAAARVRVDLLNQNAATLQKDSNALQHQIGVVVVPACEAKFHK